MNRIQSSTDPALEGGEIRTAATFKGDRVAELLELLLGEVRGLRADLAPASRVESSVAGLIAERTGAMAFNAAELRMATLANGGLPAAARGVTHGDSTHPD